MMIRRYQDGQANLTATLLLVGLIVAIVWIWKRLPLATQDSLVERAIPLTLLGVAVALFVWVVGRKIHRRWKDRVERDRLMLRFERETSPEKRLDLAFEVIELNRYKLKGLERVAPAMAELFVTTMKTARATSSIGSAAWQPVI